MRKSLVAPNYETYEYDPKMAFHSNEKQMSHVSNVSTGQTSLKSGKLQKPGAPIPKKKKTMPPNATISNQRSQSYGPSFVNIHQSQQTLQKKQLSQPQQNPPAPKSQKLDKSDKNDFMKVQKWLEALENFQDTCERELIELHLKN